MNKEYDVIVLGGGPGGYVAAARAGQVGLRTVLIEKENIGGTCVNWGCIPTKVLLRNSEVVHLLSQGKTYGFEMEKFTLDYAKAQQRSRQTAKRQQKRVEALLKNRSVETIQGEGVLIGNEQVQIRETGGIFSGKNIILATGSTPKRIPTIKICDKCIITSREALQFTELPASVIIVGAGSIGMEFATIWNRYGVRVTVLELADQILPTEDVEISQEAQLQFKKAGIIIRTKVRVDRIDRVTEGVKLLVSTEQGVEELTADKVLMAVGYAPNSQNLGLEELGIKTSHGFVEIDEEMRTNVPNIYGIGDLTGKMGLAHVASAQGLHAVDAILGCKSSKLVYENIPRCTFGQIEVASVGLTEKQALERGYQISVVKSPLVPNGKALALNENCGFMKLIMDKDSKKLLGVHLVGSHVAEIIGGAAMMISLGAPIDQMAEVIFPHPTISEAIMEGLHALAGHAVHL